MDRGSLLERVELICLGAPGAGMGRGGGPGVRGVSAVIMGAPTCASLFVKPKASSALLKRRSREYLYCLCECVESEGA